MFLSFSQVAVIAFHLAARHVIEKQGRYTLKDAPVTRFLDGITEIE